MSQNYLRPLWAMLLALLTFTNAAHAWWNEEWTVRKQITIDTSAAEVGVSSPVGSAVVLLRLHDGNFQFAEGKDDGSDIRILAEDDKTLLPYHVERFDSLLNEAFLWVRIPEVKAGGKTVIWLYNGNTGDKAVSVQDAKATYDAETQLVFHFGEKGTPPSDSSGRGNLAQNGGVAVTGSLIGGGVRVDGRTPITIPTSESLGWTAGGALTLSLWLKPGTLAANAVILARRQEASAFLVGLDNGSPYLEIDGQRASSAAKWEVNTWHHVAVIAESGKVSLYVDGEAAASLAVSLPALQGPLLLAAIRPKGLSAWRAKSMN